MKVLNLRCANGHGFEGWFASDDDYMDQNGRGLVECPMCADKVITRMPSAPRLNLSGAREAEPAVSASASASTSPSTPQQPQPPQPADLQAAFMKAVREMIQRTEDVGPRFAEEARRIHYGEAPERGIRGKASAEEREALRDEGIETFALPVPPGLDGPLQ
ncbi:MAG: DUF1178 family protein [Betaproteobacteria bacterium]|nr:DUF1178 family protein [Betaproteobacteria bacterium]